MSKPKQVITSAATSVKQVPAIFRLMNKNLVHPALFWARNREVLDYGGGRFDLLTENLADIGVRNWVYDPFNRSDAHNALVRQMLTIQPADIAICANVLNVIKEPAVRREVLRDIKRLLNPEGTAWFTFYEGNRSSRGKKTTKGWQANRPTKNYIKELRKEFQEGWFVTSKLIAVRGFRDK